MGYNIDLELIQQTQCAHWYTHDSLEKGRKCHDVLSCTRWVWQSFVPSRMDGCTFLLGAFQITCPLFLCSSCICFQHVLSLAGRTAGSAFEYQPLPIDRVRTMPYETWFVSIKKKSLPLEHFQIGTFKITPRDIFARLLSYWPLFSRWLCGHGMASLCSNLKLTVFDIYHSYLTIKYGSCFLSCSIFAIRLNVSESLGFRHKKRAIRPAFSSFQRFSS